MYSMYMSSLLIAMLRVHGSNTASKGLIENIEELKVCMRICKEVGAFRNLNAFIYAMEETIVLARQMKAGLKVLRIQRLLLPHPSPKSLRGVRSNGLNCKGWSLRAYQVNHCAPAASVCAF